MMSRPETESRLPGGSSARMIIGGVHNRRAVRAGGARVQQPGGDVVDRGHRVLQVKRLKYETDPVGAEAGELGVAAALDGAAGDADLARGRPLQRSQNGEQ